MVKNECCFILPLTQANSRSDLTDCFELAIPIFHAYGHKMECQVHYLIQKCVSKCGLYTNDYKFQISLH